MENKSKLFEVNSMKSYFNLEKKNIIITGAAGFLGSQYVEALIQFNANPICLDINFAKLKILKNNIQKKYNVNLEIYKTDISSEKEVIKIKKKIYKKFNSVDVLINNAAKNPTMKKIKKNVNFIENYQMDSWYKEIKIGLTGSFLMSKIFGSEMSKNKNGGNIINISSDLGIISPDQRLYISKNGIDKKPITYSIVKTGIIGMTRYLATYWKNKIRCNALCIGGMENNHDKNFVKKLAKLIPMGRMAKKNEYNGAIVFLCSDASSYMNGSLLVLDGGRTII